MQRVDFRIGIRRAAMALLLLGIALFGLAACGGGGGDSGPDPGSASGGGSGDGASSSRVITAALQSGSFLEFLATSTSSSSSPGGTSSSNDYGIFRVTLGAPAVVGGISGFSVAVSGKTQVGGHQFKPAWTFVGLSGQRWVGSSDGVNLTTLYDPQLPPGTTGFFLNVPAGRRVSARAATLDGSYNDFSGIAVSDATSDGGCQLVLSIPICSDTSTSFSQSEYLKDGIGPAGLIQRIGYSAGGSAPQVINLSLTLELIGTSLAASDGTAVKPPPWTDAAPMPISRVDAFASEVGNKIYLYGGSSGDAAFSSDRIDVFDIASGTWSRGADAPRLLFGWRGVTAGNRVAMFSGSQGLLHDPASGTWTSTAMLSGSGLLTGVGAWTHSDGTTDVVAVLDPGAIYINATLYRYTVATNTWSTIGTINKGQRYQYETAMVGDHFYLIGGYANGTYLKSVLDINIATSQYGPISGRLATGRIGTSAAALSGKVYIVGGHNYGGAERDVQILDPENGAISAGPVMFGGRYGAATTVADGKLYVMGGSLAGVSGPSTNVVVLNGSASVP